MTGRTFNRWTVGQRIWGRGRSVYLCHCSCGQAREVTAYSLTSGTSRSCGCLGREETRVRLTTHGKTNHPLFKTWRGMLNRCENPNRAGFKDYGGRGIAVCERWRSFDAFYADMAPSWSPGLTIERDDNGKGYSPENCRWIPRSEQSRNRRFCVYIDTPSGRVTVNEASRIYGISFATLRGRIKRGWPPEQLLRPAGRKGTNGSDRANWGCVHS